MAAYWQANAATVQAWKTSWNPDHPGHGSGRRSRQALASALYSRPPAPRRSARGQAGPEGVAEGGAEAEDAADDALADGPLLVSGSGPLEQAAASAVTAPAAARYRRRAQFFTLPPVPGHGTRR